MRLHDIGYKFEGIWKYWEFFIENIGNFSIFAHKTDMIMYYQRLIEDQIALKLKSSGAVLVAGPKFCGKTTTCMLYQKSFVKLNTKQTIAMARMNPKAVLDGEKTRLFFLINKIIII